MRLACNAPANLWDKFICMVAYLTNLMALSSIGGKMPYEKWFSCIPSLSHLQEIGCCAFTLITTNNPKIYQHSVPCVLIRYAPHSKAYCLWNPASGRVFNSFHISFIEHLKSLSSSLLPDTYLNLDVDTMPPSWDVVMTLPDSALHSSPSSSKSSASITIQETPEPSSLVSNPNISIPTTDRHIITPLMINSPLTPTIDHQINAPLTNPPTILDSIPPPPDSPIPPPRRST